MAEIVRMPKLSDTMTEGVVAAWHKKVGDTVKSGELLADIETDKATMEFESFQDGVLLHIGVEKGKAAPVDSILAILGKSGEDVSTLLNGSAQNNNVNVSSTNNQTQAVTNNEVAPKISVAPKIPDSVEVVKMPKLSDTMTDGVVSKWHKKIGDKVKTGELLADIQTDKATMEFESFQDGVLIHIGVAENGVAPVDSVLAILGNGDENVAEIIAALSTPKDTENFKNETLVSTQPSSTKEEISKSVASNTSSKTINGRTKASPLAKKIASDKGIDISSVVGTGDDGRITRKDIENYKPSATQKSSVSNTGFAANTESYIEETVSQMRKTIAKRLAESKFTAPHFYLNLEINMDKAIEARAAINNISESKVSFNDIIIKAVATSLKKHPKINSSWLGDKIRYNNHVNIGVAMAVEDGLLVPVVRQANFKSISEIAKEVKNYSVKAKDKKLQPADWEGNTFTISNLGMFGIDEFTAIINPPDACILAVGGIKETAIVKNGAIAIGNIMKLTLSCDHRVVDGATGAAFLQTLKALLENPVTILA
jgi:pyruvate dehydrogenase E2 component (dihydrolipoamide acetyltransferase)